jgi:endonuclease/exonuclease/phosphatase (EEP) superfamily protein YafD
MSNSDMRLRSVALDGGDDREPRSGLPGRPNPALAHRHAGRSARTARAMKPVDLIRHLAIPLSALFVYGCVTVTVDSRAVVSGTGAAGDIMTLKCDAAARVLQGLMSDGSENALDGRAFRVLVWNIHKEEDGGWQRDLAAFAAANDVMLLQETVLQPSLREIIDDAGLRWVMASSFLYDANDIGVLTATRIAPVASCTQRMLEPLLRIPKSAVITWLRIKGRRETLAIVNVHAINFDLFIDRYRTQFGALVDALSGHEGPIVFAGDFNSWNDARDRVVAETAARLGLIELEPGVDQRATFLGRHVDHIFVRGLDMVDVIAIPVTSSDHNPVAATLRLR